MWSPQLNIRFKNFNKILYSYYSRRSDSKSAGSYKVVKSRKTADDISNTSVVTNPNANWELLTPRGYRFYMPGSVGPAWHDAYTTAHLEEFRSMSSHQRSDSQVSEYSVECAAQACPMLLRRGILAHFPGCDLGASNLTVVTISQKAVSDLSSTGQEEENEREKLTKFFVLAAQEVCSKLRLAGYWADFINPFSGRPYLNPGHGGMLHETDERPKCLDFQINTSGKCKVISSDNTRSPNFVGSLFTNAPPSTTLLHDILEQYD